MKRSLISSIVLLLAFPLIVLANVDENTQTTTWEASTENAASLCASAENNNTSSELAKATSGYYLYCVKVSCDKGVNVHKVDNPLSKSLTCANGNTNPYIKVSSSGASGVELKAGASCSENGIYAYATEKVFYNCAKVNDEEESEYTGSNLSNTTTTKATTTTKKATETTTQKVTNNTNTTKSANETNTNNTNETNKDASEESIKSPETGIEDYILPLTFIGVIFITSLYIINRKNVFKKI
jgi:hypothetical protein